MASNTLGGLDFDPAARLGGGHPHVLSVQLVPLPKQPHTILPEPHFVVQHGPTESHGHNASVDTAPSGGSVFILSQRTRKNLPGRYSNKPLL